MWVQIVTPSNAEANEQSASGISRYQSSALRALMKRSFRKTCAQIRRRDDGGNRGIFLKMPFFPHQYIKAPEDLLRAREVSQVLDLDYFEAMRLAHMRYRPSSHLLDRGLTKRRAEGRDRHYVE